MSKEIKEISLEEYNERTDVSMIKQFLVWVVLTFVSLSVLQF